MLFNLSDQNSIASRFLLELRHRDIQRDRMRFRRNLERIGEILAYEVSRKLPYKKEQVSTSLGTAEVNDLVDEPVLISILRAGVPFLQGFLNFFDRAETGFVGAWRNESGASLAIHMNYLATPGVEGRDLIVIDPMLATGGSLAKALSYLISKGKPRSIHVVSVIAAPEGIKNVSAFLGQSGIAFHMWTASLDERLNDQYYIVPGLGDAGDLSYGDKTE